MAISERIIIEPDEAVRTLMEFQRLLREVAKDQQATGKRAEAEGKRGARAVGDAYEREAGRIGKAMQRVKGWIAGALTVAGIGQAVRHMVGLNAQYERYAAILKTVTGSQEAAQKKLDFATRFAATTPFEVSEIVEATVRLEAYGIKAEKVLEDVGNAASAMGKPIMDVVEALADAQTAEFERLKELGIRVVEQGGKTMMLYTDRFGKEQRKIIDRNNREMITSTLQAIWNERYKGAMRERAQTFEGMMSNVRDTLSMLSKDIGEGLFSALKGDLQSLLERIADLSADGSLARWAKNAGEALLDVYRYGKQTLGLIIQYGPALLRLATVLLVVRGAYVAGAAAQQAYLVLTGKSRIATILLAGAKALLAGNTARATRALHLFNAATKTSGIGLLLGLLGAAASAFLLFRDRANDATDALREQTRAARELRSAIGSARGAQLADLKGEAERGLEAARGRERAAYDNMDRLRRKGRAFQAFTGAQNAGRAQQVPTEEYQVELDRLREAQRQQQTTRDALRMAEQAIQQDLGAQRHLVEQRIEDLRTQASLSKTEQRELDGLNRELARLDRVIGDRTTDTADAPGGSGAGGKESGAAKRARESREAAQQMRRARHDQEALTGSTTVLGQARARLAQIERDLAAAREAAHAETDPEVKADLLTRYDRAAERAEAYRQALSELEGATARVADISERAAGAQAAMNAAATDDERREHGHRLESLQAEVLAAWQGVRAAEHGVEVASAQADEWARASVAARALAEHVGGMQQAMREGLSLGNMEQFGPFFERLQAFAEAVPRALQRAQLDALEQGLSPESTDKMLQGLEESMARQFAALVKGIPFEELPEALRGPFMLLAGTIEGQLGDALDRLTTRTEPAARAAEEHAKQAERTAQAYERAASALDDAAALVGAISQLGRSLGVVSEELDNVARGAEDALRSLAQVQLMRAARQRGEAVSSASMLLGYLGIAGGVVSAIGTLVSAFRSHGEAQREEARARREDAQRLSEALRDTAREIRRSAEALLTQGQTVGERINPQGVSSARGQYNLIGSISAEIARLQQAWYAATSDEERLAISAEINRLTDQLGMEFPRLLQMLEDAGVPVEQWREMYDLFRQQGMSASQAARLVMEHGAGGSGPMSAFLRQFFDAFGQIPRSVEGALSAFEAWQRLMGMEAPEAVKRFAQMLLGLGDDLPVELKKALEEVATLDLTTEEGQQRLQALVQSLGGLLLSGGFSGGALTADQINRILETLLRGGSGAGAGASGESRSAGVSRSITEVQANTVVHLLEVIAHYARRLESIDTWLRQNGMPGGVSSAGAMNAEAMRAMHDQMLRVLAAYEPRPVSVAVDARGGGGALSLDARVQVDVTVEDVEWKRLSPRSVQNLGDIVSEQIERGIHRRQRRMF